MILFIDVDNPLGYRPARVGWVRITLLMVPFVIPRRIIKYHYLLYIYQKI